MKNLSALLCLSLCLFCLAVYAEPVYEKVDDYTLKTTVETTTIDVEEVTLTQLLLKKVWLLEEIQQNYRDYKVEDDELKAILAVVETKIAEAELLGIKEFPTE